MLDNHSNLMNIHFFAVLFAVLLPSVHNFLANVLDKVVLPEGAEQYRRALLVSLQQIDRAEENESVKKPEPVSKACDEPPPLPPRPRSRTSEEVSLHSPLAGCRKRLAKPIVLTPSDDVYKVAGSQSYSCLQLDVQDDRARVPLGCRKSSLVPLSEAPAPPTTTKPVAHHRTASNPLSSISGIARDGTLFI